MSGDVPLLEVSGLRKSFGGVEALRDVSFRLAQGEIVALIGPNGAGKSTCFNVLSGQIAPDAGRVRIGGQDVAGAPARAVWALGVGRTFQIAATFASITVRENVAVGIAGAQGATWQVHRGLDAAGLAEPSDTLLRLVGLAAQAGRPCAELAYGDLKRLELAMALTNAPRLLLMDEPTAGMAPGERAALMDLVSGIARSRRIGVLFTEHDMDVVFGHAARVMVLDRGRLIADSTPDAVRADPRVRAVYLGDSVAEARP